MPDVVPTIITSGIANDNTANNKVSYETCLLVSMSVECQYRSLLVLLFSMSEIVLCTKLVSLAFLTKFWS